MEALTLEDAELDSKYHGMIIDDATMGNAPERRVVHLWNKDRVTLAPGASSAGESPTARPPRGPSPKTA